MVAEYLKKTKFEAFIEDHYGKGKHVLIWGAKDETSELDVQCFRTGGLSRPNMAILIECKNKQKATLEDFEKFVKRLRVFAREYEGANYGRKFANNPLLASSIGVDDTERKGVFYYTGELDKRIGDYYLKLPREGKNMIRVRRITF